MYGVEIIYMPRRFVSERIVIKENLLSKFDENYAIEAYVSSYQGFGGGGDILSKFGVQSKDELTLVISKERFEDFISPFMIDVDGNVKESFKLATRPKEGDLIYFPLSDTIFEIKFVEHEREFYQLNKLYVYELVCEAFEYEDEIIDTGIEEVDDNFAERGYAAKLTLVGIGQTATAITSLRNGTVSKIYVDKAGYGYNSAPTIAIGAATAGGLNATAVAIMTNRSVTGVSTGYSIKSIQITNPGAGYTAAPILRFIGGGGSGAIATAGISTTGSVGIVTITSGGDKYVTIPTVTFTSAPAGGVTAIGTAIVSAAGTISQIITTNAGFGYTITPTITISSPSGVGTGNFVLNEVVTGAASSTTAIVKTWDADTLILKVNNVTGTFRLGEIVVGSATTFSHVGLGTTGVYMISKIEKMNDTDIDDFESYQQNEEIENAASSIVDFSEKNPFGDY
jgi:hypothetical protein